MLSESGSQANRSTAKLLPVPATVADDVKSPALFCGGEKGMRGGTQQPRMQPRNAIVARIMPAAGNAPTHPTTDFLPKSGRQENRRTAKLLPAPATVADDVKSPPFFAAGKRACVAVYSKHENTQETPLLRGSCPPPQKMGIEGDLTKGSVSRFLVTLF